MDALTYDEPKKAKKSLLLHKIDEKGEELAYLQRKSRELGIPVLVVVEGLSAAGKENNHQSYDSTPGPRGFKVTCIVSPNRDEQLRPFLGCFLAAYSIR